MKKYDYIIVGGGPALRIFNHYLNMFNPEVSVLAIRGEERIANHCSIPYILDGTVPMDKGGITSDKLVTQFGTTLVKEKVVSGNPEEKYVVTDKGNRFGYKTLVLATGSKEFIPPVTGIDLPGVLKVRDYEDFKNTYKAVNVKKSFIVIGHYCPVISQIK